MSYEAIAASLALEGASLNERLVAFSLASFANREQRAWPGTRVAAARAGLCRSQYLSARAGLVGRGLVEVENPGGGRGNPPVVLLRFALTGPWLDVEVNARAFERTLGVSRSRGAARLLLAVLAAFADEELRVEGVMTAELCAAAGLADTSYRRARAALLAAGEASLPVVGGGRGRCNAWRLCPVESVAVPGGRVARAGGTARGSAQPLLAVTHPVVERSEGADSGAGGFGSEGKGPGSGGVSALNGPGSGAVPVLNPAAGRMVCAKTPAETRPETPPAHVRAGREPGNQRSSPPNPPAGGSPAGTVTITEPYITEHGRRRERTATVSVDAIGDELRKPVLDELTSWGQARSRLEQAVGEEMFAIWLAELEPVASTRDEVLLLDAPSVLRDWIGQRFGELLDHAGRDAGQQVRLATSRELELLAALSSSERSAGLEAVA